jgi:hypothetical protein
MTSGALDKANLSKLIAEELRYADAAIARWRSVLYTFRNTIPLTQEKTIVTVAGPLTITTAYKDFRQEGYSQPTIVVHRGEAQSVFSIVPGVSSNIFDLCEGQPRAVYAFLVHIRKVCAYYTKLTKSFEKHMVSVVKSQLRYVRILEAELAAMALASDESKK